MSCPPVGLTYGLLHRAAGKVPLGKQEGGVGMGRRWC